MSDGFTLGQSVRYRPGSGTYGYEDSLQPDGRVPGEVIGFSRARVRVRLTLEFGRQVERCVDGDSLVVAEERFLRVRLKHGFHQGTCRVVPADICRAKREGVIWIVEVDGRSGRFERFSADDVDVVPAEAAR